MANKKIVEDKLRRKNLRITKQRRLILDIINNNKSHPNAVDIYKEAAKIVPSISLSTVYRTMTILEKEGAIQRHSFANGPARFENAILDHHDHLIDLESGSIIEFHCEKIEQIQQEIAKQLGYDIIYHKLELYGRKIKN